MPVLPLIGISLNPAIDRSFQFRVTIHKDSPQYSTFTCMVSPLQADLG